MRRCVSGELLLNDKEDKFHYFSIVKFFDFHDIILSLELKGEETYFEE